MGFYQKSNGTRNCLFMRQPSSSSVVQLTGITPLMANNGYTFLPGSTGSNQGLLMQWGQLSGPFDAGSANTITFPQTFSVVPYQVYVTAFKSSGNRDSNFVYIVSGSLQTGQFQVGCGGGSINSISWLAIGAFA